MVSAVIQSLIDKGLFDRIPPTFSTFFFDQMKDWDTLFPAERGYHERLFSLIDRLPGDAFDSLFAPLRAVEQKMGVNERTWPRRTFTLQNVDFLNRNPHYAEWRRVIAGLFGRLDPVLDEEQARHGRPCLSIILAPPELPVGPDRMWTRLKGRRVGLTSPIDPKKHIEPLLAAGLSKPYDRWLIQASGAIEAPKGVVAMNYDALADYRKRLMTDIERMVEKEQLRGPRELGERLKQMKIRPEESEVGRDPLLAEFCRAILLAGNGTLLLNNTFVEWATVQAVRRARPQIVVVGFGVRNKMKPFSSLLIYQDQEAASPVPTQVDTLGTYVDLEVFYQYVWQEFEKYVEYRNNTVHLFIGGGMDAALVIAPADFRIGETASPEHLIAAILDWIN